MAQIKAEFIEVLQGKQFVTYVGLLDYAHQLGLQGITTRVVQLPTEANGHTTVVEAAATFEGGRVFAGIGDANPSNVNRKIAQHAIRMAETRAKARALRDGTNITMGCRDELAGDEPDLFPERGGGRATAAQPSGNRRATGAQPSGNGRATAAQPSGDLDPERTAAIAAIWEAMRPHLPQGVDPERAQRVRAVLLEQLTGNRQTKGQSTAVLAALPQQIDRAAVLAALSVEDIA